MNQRGFLSEVLTMLQNNAISIVAAVLLVALLIFFAVYMKKKNTLARVTGDKRDSSFVVVDEIVYTDSKNIIA